MIAKTKASRRERDAKTLKVAGSLMPWRQTREIVEKLYRTRSVETAYGRALARLRPICVWPGR